MSEERARTDVELLTDASVGGEQAFQVLIARHRPMLRAMALRLCDTPADADDALQEAVLGAWLGARTFRGECTVRTWLSTITTNAARKIRRRRVGEPRDRVGLDPEEVPASSLPEQTVAERELKQRLKAALRELEVDAREVLVLEDLVGLSGEETAMALGLTLAATKSRLHRARLELKERMDGPAVAEPPAGAGCAEVLADLSSYLDGELERGGVAAIELHLKGCDRCTRFGGEFAGMVSTLRASLLETAP